MITLIFFWAGAYIILANIIYAGEPFKEVTAVLCLIVFSYHKRDEIPIKFRLTSYSILFIAYKLFS